MPSAITTRSPTKGPFKRHKFFCWRPFAAFGNLRPPRKARKALSELSIELDEPHRQYTPGDLVTGSVVVMVERDTRVTHLVVDLIGRVDLYGVANSGYTSSGKRRKVNYAQPVEFEGGVILCRDQQVLCGEGRLEAGVYKFKFVLELSGKGLPSSLDFEKGSISYKVTATFTRPTTISPTKVCERRFSLVELIDIAPLKPPKPRVMMLDQPKRGRARSSHSSSDEKCAISEQRTNSIPPSPGGSGNQINLENAQIERPLKPSKNAGVCATVELLRAGCLPGGFLPIRIDVTHNKPIKSMHGIIITLIRQGRFDTVPLSTYGNFKSSSSSIKKGLSLYSADSMTTFRKDLTQTIMPLIVDPVSHSAVIKTSVRVPEGAFPTITSVPGQIVSFRYFVEVVVDLGGKLANRDGFLDGVTMAHIPTVDEQIGEITGDAKSKIASGMADPSSMMAIWGGQVIETDSIRRNVKNVVHCRFEVVVGNTDSAKRTGRGQTLMVTEIHPGDRHSAISDDRITGESSEVSSMANTETSEERLLPIRLDQRAGHSPKATAIVLPTPPSPNSYHLTPVQLPLIPEPPPLDPEMDEKTRLRIAEQSLLPSEPPSFASAATHSTPLTPPTSSILMLPEDELRRPVYSGRVMPAPSAPMLEEDEIYSTDPNCNLGSSAAVSDSPPSSSYVASGPALGLFNQPYSQHTISQAEQNTGAQAANQDDKQELERRRLMEAVSQPPHGILDQPGSSSSAPPSFSPVPTTPSAPLLDEGLDEEFDADRELPKYER